MSSAGNIVFQNLPVIFAIGVAIGLARSDKGTAGLAKTNWLFDNECNYEWNATNYR